MQNRYVGDVGDFGKYSLLRRLCDSANGGRAFRLGIAWYLFPDEGHNSDGRHISYLKSGALRHLDPELHDILEAVISAGNRNVSAIAQSNIFHGDTVFFANPVCEIAGDGRRVLPDDRVAYRSVWLKRLLESTSECDVVFFDPDNGFDTPSVAKRHQKAGKYVFRDELRPFAQRGQSLVVYHHLNRTTTVEKQVAALQKSLENEIPSHPHIVPLIFRRGSCRVFWLIMSQSHASRLSLQAREFLLSGWQNHFEGGESLF